MAYRNPAKATVSRLMAKRANVFLYVKEFFNMWKTWQGAQKDMEHAQLTDSIVLVTAIASQPKQVLTDIDDIF
ncbi:hypothetical protein KIN20_025380 [Parelaphostrongylus tenuis]|uniref:Uncharacterized protein n=1 Tax=Parelaphostrongylus tenuis TaxID=148309 RepID=A0AAD5N8S6_PARTN|nr:hypothetical protein KIN20_025380 [Parelaphostrongylus tenuis]